MKPHDKLNALIAMLEDLEQQIDYHEITDRQTMVALDSVCDAVAQAFVRMQEVVTDQIKEKCKKS